MFDYIDFVTKRKSLLIAPAGYGKTHTIAECLKYTPDGECQLIITHTHAGVASIKEKIKKLNIPNNKYQVETITSFAQKYVLAFYTYSETPFPIQENSGEYYNFIIQEASKLFKYNSVRRIISATYKGLFVDEYQDCTKLQHEMVLTLSDVFPTHILGDPLQGIMNFNGDLIDMDNDTTSFVRVPPLDTPYRWYIPGRTKKLGDTLKSIRELLLDQETIDMSNYNYNNNAICVFKINDNKDIYDPNSEYREILKRLINNVHNNHDLDNLLLIVPEKMNNIPLGSVYQRAKLKSLIDYKQEFYLIEAIDEKTFYSISKNIDTNIAVIQNSKHKIKKLCDEILEPLFDKTCINKWFDAKRNCLINKRGHLNQIRMRGLNDCLNSYFLSPSVMTIKPLLAFLKKELRFKSMRNGLINTVLKVLDIAETDNQSVYQSMILYKNILRRSGRKISGKCIGTTALTKGLEFDTVAILDAHEFTCPKNFYVAITRASKMLILFTKNEKFSFHFD